MSESLARTYDRSLSDIAEDARSMPRRRPNETEAEYDERLSRWRAMNVVEKAVKKIGRYGE